MKVRKSLAFTYDETTAYVFFRPCLDNRFNIPKTAHTTTKYQHFMKIGSVTGFYSATTADGNEVF